MAVVVVAAVCNRGESVAALHALLEHCNRTGALLATGIKYTDKMCKVTPFSLFFLSHCIYVLISFS